MILFAIYLLGIPCMALFVCGTYDAAGITPETAGDKEFRTICWTSVLWPIIIPLFMCFYLGHYLERQVRNG